MGDSDDQTRFGVFLHRSVLPRDATPAVEELGFDYVAAGEHIAGWVPTTHSLIALAVIAGMTRKIGLLSLITLVPLYPAGLLVKLVSELALHSDGRFELGVGVGGESEAEFRACGVALEERGPRTDEALDILRGALNEGNTSYHGRFWSFDKAEIAPRPDRCPPIWCGGRRRGAMARAARFGDVWIPYLYTPDQLRSSVETVRTHAGKLGRSPDDIDVGIFVFIHVAGAHAKDTAKRLLSTLYGSDMRTLADRYVVAGPPDACVAQLYEFWLAGARRFIFSTLAESAEEHLQMWAALSQDIVPPFRSLCAAGGGT